MTILNKTIGLPNDLMEKFICYEGFQLYYDQAKVRCERSDGQDFIEFSMEDPELILYGENIGFPEIDLLSNLIKSNQSIMKARLRGEWVEVEETNEANRL